MLLLFVGYFVNVVFDFIIVVVEMSVYVVVVVRSCFVVFCILDLVVIGLLVNDWVWVVDLSVVDFVIIFIFCGSFCCFIGVLCLLLLLVCFFWKLRWLLMMIFE